MFRYEHVRVNIESGPLPTEVTWQVTSDPALHFDWSAARQNIAYEDLISPRRRSAEQCLAEILADQADEELEQWESQHEPRITMQERMARAERIPEQPVHWSWLHGPAGESGDGAS